MAATNTIWVVYACYDYEGSTAIAAYESEAKANQVCEDYNLYHADKVWADGNLEGEAFDREMKKVSAWDDAHPAGRQYSSCDRFIVNSLELNLTPPRPEPPPRPPHRIVRW